MVCNPLKLCSLKCLLYLYHRTYAYVLRCFYEKPQISFGFQPRLEVLARSVCFSLRTFFQFATTLAWSTCSPAFNTWKSNAGHANRLCISCNNTSDSGNVNFSNEIWHHTGNAPVVCFRHLGKSDLRPSPLELLGCVWMIVCINHAIDIRTCLLGKVLGIRKAVNLQPQRNLPNRY